MTAVLIGLSVERPEVKTYQLFGPRKSFLWAGISHSAQRSEPSRSPGPEFYTKYGTSFGGREQAPISTR